MRRRMTPGVPVNVTLASAPGVTLSYRWAALVVPGRDDR